ncbi:hypothetical protein EKK58_09295 [Candidatus Dependentiae bacterium]|nr:MAG: hypothetical protein EKK58_09295 [Candidatus Dependentiae bacterium]
MTELVYRKCTAEHIKLIVPQYGMEAEKMLYLSPEYADVLTENFALSAWAGVKCIAAAGIVHCNKHRAVGWTLIGRNAGPYMRQITKKVRNVLDGYAVARLEMTVRTDFHEGHRWAELLGFEMEAARMRKHGLNGEDETLYVRIKE